ncbi:MAG TPA: glycosyl hydrolase 108 family protein [Acetobacteraceae bacterium]|jgi:lysozyme family protein|nr:glycosyl hydrolase 108 family protein [Acetobacteraceae bacterium]
MTNFDRMFALVSGHEGNYSGNPDDPGNWTGGAIGIGRCLGTKFGISAAAYPNADIPNLTLDEAKALYQHDYWDRIAGDRLPAPLALLVFDAAINNGTERAVSWLQDIAHVTRDGVVGPVTLAAVDRLAVGPDGVAGLCSEYLARRLVFMASLSAWKTFGLGWARRLFKLPFETLPYLAK